MVSPRDSERVVTAVDSVEAAKRHHAIDVWGGFQFPHRGKDFISAARGQYGFGRSAKDRGQFLVAHPPAGAAEERRAAGGRGGERQGQEVGAVAAPRGGEVVGVADPPAGDPAERQHADDVEGELTIIKKLINKNTHIKKKGDRVQSKLFLTL